MLLYVLVHFVVVSDESCVHCSDIVVLSIYVLFGIGFRAVEGVLWLWMCVRIHGYDRGLSLRVDACLC